MGWLNYNYIGITLLVVIYHVVKGEVVPAVGDWTRLVAILEGREQPWDGGHDAFGVNNPPNEDAEHVANLFSRHLPELKQVGNTTFQVLTPHGMLWDSHYIEAIYVKAENGSVVYFANMTAQDDRVSLFFDIDSEAFRGQQLFGYSMCNLHGLWVSESVLVVDPVSWNIVSSHVKNEDDVDNNSQEGTCNIGMIVKFGGQRELNLKLLDADMGIPQNMSMVEYLQVTFRIPTGTFFGLGLGSSMMTDMMIAGEQGGSVVCGDFFVKDRYFGPEPDTKLGGTNDVVLRNSTIESGMVEAVCTKRMNGADGNDVVYSFDGPHDFVFAFNNIAGANRNKGLNPESADWFAYHSLSNRGYLALDLSSVTEGLNTVSVAADSERQKRDLKVVHGVLMYTIWGINIMVGAMIARYARNTKWWLGAHRALQGVNTIVTLPVFFLARAFVDRSYASVHAIMGYAVIYLSWIQAASGTYAYLSGKLSQRLYDLAKKTKLSTGVMNFIELELTKFGGKNFFHNWHERCSRLSPAEKEELDQFIKYGIKRSGFGLFSKCGQFMLTHVNPAMIRPIHRWLGRLLPVIAVAQMFLGLEQLEASPIIEYMLIGWTTLLGFAVLYKEIELQFQLPANFSGKVKLLVQNKTDVKAPEEFTVRKSLTHTKSVSLPPDNDDNEDDPPGSGPSFFISDITTFPSQADVDQENDNKDENGSKRNNSYEYVVVN